MSAATQHRSEPAAAAAQRPSITTTAFFRVDTYIDDGQARHHVTISDGGGTVILATCIYASAAERIRSRVESALADAIRAAELAAADDFAVVPETTLPNGTVVPSFLVGRYLCSKSAGGSAIVSRIAAPWVEIDYHAARQACLDAGYQLITELQALALAHNIASVAANWTGGAVGKGNLRQGLRLDSVNEAQPASFEPPNPDERRTFVLSNGEVIIDAAGNAFTWVFDNAQGDAYGLVAKPFAPTSPSISTALHMYASLERGVGWYPAAGRNWSGDALIRGGCWGSGSGAGVFYLDDGWPDYAYDYVGFRCTKPGP